MKAVFLNTILIISLIPLAITNATPLGDQQSQKGDELIFVQRAEFEALQNLVHDLMKKLDQSTSSQRLVEDWDKVTVSANPKAVGATSCLDLWKFNQTEPGYYLVRSADQKKMSAVYCDVSTYTENLIGYLDIKTSPVYFFATRTGEYKNDNKAVILTYPSVTVSHESFNGLSGRFTAPVAGIYKFDFFTYAYSHRDAGESTSNGARVVLLINGAEMTAYNYADSDRPSNLPLSFTFVYHLAKNEYVETRFQYGNLRDCHFSGVLLEADLA